MMMMLQEGVVLDPNCVIFKAPPPGAPKSIRPPTKMTQWRQQTKKIHRKFVAFLQPWLLSVLPPSLNVGVAHLHLYINSDASRVYQHDAHMHDLLTVFQQPTLQTLRLSVQRDAPHWGATDRDADVVQTPPFGSYRFHLQFEDDALFPESGEPPTAMWETYLWFARPVYTSSPLPLPIRIHMKRTAPITSYNGPERCVAFVVVSSRKRVY